MIGVGQCQLLEIGSVRHRDIRGIVNTAAEFATESPEPDPAELYTDVMA